MSVEPQLIRKIRAAARSAPEALALVGVAETLSYRQLLQQMEQLADLFRTLPATRVAIDMENGPAWAVVDLALLCAGKVAVPIPAFFSRQQVSHLLQDCGVELLLTSSPQRYAQQAARSAPPLLLCGETLYLLQLRHTPVVVPGDTVKVTYTSGTTAEPKGVCIGEQAILSVVESVKQCSAIGREDSHLSLLPLTTLLENVAGLYVALAAAATITLLPQSQLGIRGACGIDADRFIRQLEESGATTTILIPQMVQLLVTARARGLGQRLRLRFAALGGATISPRLLQLAEQQGLALYQGYGLSEATSVVSVNRPAENRIGSVGKPLPHIDLKIAEDGELWVKGSLFNGYLGGEPPLLDEQGYLATGDLAELDEAGFLILKGRRKQLLITAFGRNVSPDWVERELLIQPGILQAVLFGDGRPWNVAVVVSLPGADVEAAVQLVNQGLPDYARIGQWIAAEEPFSLQNGEWTGTARPRREVIWRHYEEQINRLYAGNCLSPVTGRVVACESEEKNRESVV
jgi:long-chain acyl-CoA synthetase